MANSPFPPEKAWFLSASWGDLPAIQELCVSHPHFLDKRNANGTENHFKETALSKVCLHNNVDIIRKLLDAGAVVTKEAFCAAARKGHIEVLQVLRVANPALPLDVGVLSAACYSGHVPIVRYLVEDARVDVNQNLNNYGHTVLHVAAETGRMGVVQYLLEQGANPHAYSNNYIDRFPVNDTPATLARNNGYFEVADFIDNYRRN
eukprot:TRINITY_DN7500_c0_g2_i3.p1 TRINITY_DN7500_c0_g2~~TRINITY_DN7500_c0_g2_i3.p1  ORF type:complete len:205 (+),score=13.00 TRINITY_DN7500_c0_g2_i3:63-677(+)